MSDNRFNALRKVLEEWGFDVTHDMQNDLPSALLQRMLDEVGIKCGEVEKEFIRLNTETYDKRSYIAASTWTELEDNWITLLSEKDAYTKRMSELGGLKDQ